MARQVEGPWFRGAKDTWYATVAGRSVSLGVKGERNKKAAQEAWHKLMAEGPKAKPEPTAEPLTVRRLADAFLADAEARLKSSTVETYRHDVEEFAASLGTLRADRVTPADVSVWLARLKVNDTTRAIRLRSVSACFGWAVRMGLLTDSPVRRVAKPKARSRSSEAVISEGDHGKLMEKATPGFRLVLRVLHATGARPGEVVRISTDTFDAAAGTVVLHEHKTDHTGRPRLICLPPDVCELLKAQAARYGTGPLLKSKAGKPWTARGITQAMRRLKRKAGVRAIAYGYRHTFATDALVRGLPDATVAALLGHSSTAMLHRHYSHLTYQARAMRDAAALVRG